MRPESIPTDAVFAAHGLSDVKLNLPSYDKPQPALSAILPLSATHQALGEYISGTAVFAPAGDRTPVLVKGPVKPRSVRFSFCPHGDAVAMAQFRRRAQISVLDTISPGIPSNFPCSSTEHRRYGRIKEVVAWWEDVDGLWLITDGEEDESMTLVEWWSRAMTDEEAVEDVGDVGHSKSHLNGSKHSARDFPDRNGALNLVRWGKACEKLVQIVDALRVSHFAEVSLI